ncbi:tetratricopeptide repeat protein [Sphingomonas panacisoli]|uniref:Tetratricopeptide repeat protein n=1 Tax=Sphingomonas panacisoli TaxID=1813879 RepID=A0A5B8LGT6_9SPHN|nr:tetratricopeptide repeat protein [Sphingomonas panacisoli]QDZ07126.1 tetratricopeptide repeat protein [Sphingomonas panacisoli]
MSGKWLVLAGLAMTGAAWGESASMTGKFPAGVREADRLGVVVVDRFDGRDGRQVESVLEQAIGAPNGQPDGVLSGGVTTGVEENRYQGSEERCVEWEKGDRSKACTKRAQVPVPCTRRVVVVTVSVRLMRLEDNLSVYSDNKSGRSEISWCEGRSPYTTVEQMVTAQIRDIANTIRGDVRPYTQTYRVRFREERDGMRKDIGNQFKAVVKLSQNNTAEACRQWAAMNGQMPNHPSVLYNLGVCAEAAGRYEDALAGYRAAQAALLPKKSGDIGDRSTASVA